MSKKTYDLNRYRKVYPLIRRKPVYAELDTKIIESTILEFTHGEIEKTYSFLKQFVDPPVCVATVQNSNLNAFIINIDTLSVTIQLSSPVYLEQNDPSVFVNLQVINRTSN